MNDAPIVFSSVTQKHVTLSSVTLAAVVTMVQDMMYVYRMITRWDNEGMIAFKHILRHDTEADIFTKNVVDAATLHRHTAKFYSKDDFLKKLQGFKTLRRGTVLEGFYFGWHFCGLLWFTCLNAENYTSVCNLVFTINSY